ncbi:hypothetical protein [Streptomyces sp. NPDC101181]
MASKVAADRHLLLDALARPEGAGVMLPVEPPSIGERNRSFAAARW